MVGLGAGPDRIGLSEVAGGPQRGSMPERRWVSRISPPMDSADLPPVPDLILGPDSEVTVPGSPPAARRRPARLRATPGSPLSRRSRIRWGLSAAVVVAVVSLFVALPRQSPRATLLVADSGSNQLVAITTVPAKVVRIASLQQPDIIAVTPDGSTAIVTSGIGTIAVVDVATGKIRSELTVGSVPTAIATSSNGSRAYVVSPRSFSVVATNLLSRQLSGIAPAGLVPTGVALSPNGDTVYVTDAGENTVTPINLVTGEAGRPIRVGLEPTSIAITPNGTMAYVVDGGAGSVTPIRLSTGTAGTPIRVGTGSELSQIAITPNGLTALVTDVRDNTVVPIHLASGSVGTPIKVGDEPEGIAISAGGATAYVTDYGSNAVTPVNLVSNTAGTPLPAGDHPIGIVIEK